MNKSTQANAKKEERRARRLALKLLISYAFQNPGAIRTIKKNNTIFNSPSDFLEFISDENNPKNLKIAKRTASFIEKKSDDLEQLLKLLDQYPDALKGIKIPEQMLTLLSNSDIQIVGKSAQKIIDNPEVIESLASVSDFIIENDTVSSFSEYLKEHQDVPPSVAIIRFIKENPEKADTFMEFIEQNSSDISQIADFIKKPENADLASALGFPQEGLEVAKFLAENREQIQPAVSMIQNEILKPELLDTAEDVALFMDKEENQVALRDILNYLSEHESELNSYEGIANFIEHCPQDLHKFSELFGNHTDSIVTLAQIFQNPDHAQYAKMFNLSDEDISSVSNVSKTIVENKDMLQAIAKSADNLLNDENFEVRSSLTEIAKFMDKPENKELINDFATYMQTKKEEGMSEPLAFIEYMKEKPNNVSEFLNFVATKHADISNIVSFTQTEENIELAEKLGLNSDVAGALSVLHENADKIEPIASLIKDKILNSDQRDKLLDSLSGITEFCTQQENIELFKQIQSGKYNFSSVEGVESFIDKNYDSTQKFIRFIGNHGEKITDLSQFVNSNIDDIKALGLDAEEIKNITSYINENSKDLKKAAELASQIFEFDAKHKSTRKTVTGFIKDENNIRSIQNISQTISKLQTDGIEPFSLEGLEQLIDKNSEDLKNVLTFIEKNPKDLATFGDFLNKNIEYARLFGLNENDAESIKSFLEILQNNPEKIQPAATFTKNLMDFYKEHPNCKEITNFYKQGDNAEQISNLIKKMSNIDLNNPEAINKMLDDENCKTILQKTSGLIRDNSDDIVAFADFLSSEENSDSINKLTKGNEGAENTVKSVNNILQITKDKQDKLQPVANVLCTALEFDSKHKGMRKSLLRLYKRVGPGLDQFINDYNEKCPNTPKEWVAVINQNSDFVKRIANWINQHKKDRREIGKFILDHKDDMTKILGTDASTLDTIAGYMVDTPRFIDFALKHPGFTLKVANFAASIGLLSDADIKKTDDPNKPLLATADMMKKDQKRAEEKSQNNVPNESLLTTADMMKKDKKRAEEKSQNIAQSMKESPKETQVPTQIPLLHNKENYFYS